MTKIIFKNFFKCKEWTKIDHQFEKYFWNDTDNMVNIEKIIFCPFHYISRWPKMKCKITNLFVCARHCLAFYCNFKKDVAVWPLPFFNCKTLKKVNNQIGQFAFGIWSPTDVKKHAFKYISILKCMQGNPIYVNVDWLSVFFSFWTSHGLFILKAQIIEYHDKFHTLNLKLLNPSDINVHSNASLVINQIR